MADEKKTTTMPEHASDAVYVEKLAETLGALLPEGARFVDARPAPSDEVKHEKVTFKAMGYVEQVILGGVLHIDHASDAVVVSKEEIDMRKTDISLTVRIETDGDISTFEVRRAPDETVADMMGRVAAVVALRAGEPVESDASRIAAWLVERATEEVVKGDGASVAEVRATALHDAAWAIREGKWRR